MHEISCGVVTSFEARCLCSGCWDVQECLDSQESIPRLSHEPTLLNVRYLRRPLVERFDFEQHGIEGWQAGRASGRWKPCLAHPVASVYWSSGPHSMLST